MTKKQLPLSGLSHSRPSRQFSWRRVFASIVIQLVHPMQKRDCAANVLACQPVFVYMLISCKMPFQGKLRVMGKWQFTGKLAGLRLPQSCSATEDMCRQGLGSFFTSLDAAFILLDNLTTSLSPCKCRMRCGCTQVPLTSATRY